MAKYRKKPVVIEAVQWLGSNIEDVLAFSYADDRWKDGLDSGNVGGPAIGHVPALGELDIPTLEGTMVAKPGDWIIRGVKGELYPCKPDIFTETYELVLEEEGEKGDGGPMANLLLSATVLEVVATEKVDGDPQHLMIIAQTSVGTTYHSAFPVERSVAPQIGDLVRFSIVKES